MAKGRVTVRIWLPIAGIADSLKSRQTPPMGHASIQTYVGGVGNKGYYISFWPISVVHISKPIARGCFKSLSYDEAVLPAREYQLTTIDLHTLDVDKINTKYEEFPRENCTWTLYASALFRFWSCKDDESNCCKFVADLLEVGEIKNLVPEYNNSDITTSYAHGGAMVGTLFGLVPILLGMCHPGMIFIFMGAGAIGGPLAEAPDPVEGKKIVVTLNDVVSLVNLARKREEMIDNSTHRVTADSSGLVRP